MTGPRDPTRLDPTTVDEQEIVPSLAQVVAAIALPSLRPLIDHQLGRGGTPDGVTGGVTELLLEAVDWRGAGVPSGRLGPAGRELLSRAVRVVVDAVDRGREPPRRRTSTPRPAVPRPARADDEEIALGGDPSEER